MFRNKVKLTLNPMRLGTETVVLENMLRYYKPKPTSMIMERLELYGEENEKTNPDGIKTRALFNKYTLCL